MKCYQGSLCLNICFSKSSSEEEEVAKMTVIEFTCFKIATLLTSLPADEIIVFVISLLKAIGNSGQSFLS